MCNFLKIEFWNKTLSQQFNIWIPLTLISNTRVIFKTWPHQIFSGSHRPIIYDPSPYHRLALHSPMTHHLTIYLLISKIMASSYISLYTHTMYIHWEQDFVTIDRLIDLMYNTHSIIRISYFDMLQKMIFHMHVFENRRMLILNIVNDVDSDVFILCILRLGWGRVNFLIHVCSKIMCLIRQGQGCDYNSITDIGIQLQQRCGHAQNQVVIGPQTYHTE